MLSNRPDRLIDSTRIPKHGSHRSGLLFVKIALGMASSQVKPHNIAPLTTAALVTFPHEDTDRRAQRFLSLPRLFSSLRIGGRLSGRTGGPTQAAAQRQDLGERKLVCGILGRHGRPQKWRACIRSTSYNFSTSTLAVGRSEVSPRVACILLHSSSSALGALGAAAESCS